MNRSSTPKPTATRRRIIKVVGALSVLALTYFALTFAQVVATTSRDDAKSAGAPHAQAIIVLGAAQYNGVPSPVLKARLNHALRLYRWGLAPVIVVTGGRQQGDRFTEATTGYNFLRDHGVPDRAIRKEVHGRTTWESLDSAAAFLHEEDIDRVILVSDGYHSKRLLGIAHEVGLHARVSPSHEPMSTGARTRAQFREAVAVSIGRITGYHLLDHR